MWKKYLASVATIGVLTPLFCGVLYMQQSYSAKLSNKVVTAAAVTTFEKENTYSLMNQVSPFQKMPALQSAQNEMPPSNETTNIPLKPYVPIPASAAIYGSSQMPIIQQMPVEKDLPSVKSVLFSEDEKSNNIAILADSQNDIMVEVGQSTKWGKVEEITPDGVYISGKLYKTKTI